MCHSSTYNKKYKHSPIRSISMKNSKSDDSDRLKSIGTFKPFGKPIMELNKASFQEMQQFFLLKIIADNPQGITAYQLARDYKINRSTVKLMLSKFEKNSYINSNTEIIDGRANKLYLLTQNGFEYLLTLKYLWFERFTMMEELALGNLTNNEKNLYIRKIENYKTKEERLEYLKAMKTRHENNMRIYERKFQTFMKMKEHITRVIEKIEQEDYLDKEELEEFFSLAIDMDHSIEKEEN